MIRNAFVLASILGGFQLLSSHALGAEKQAQTNVQVLRVSSPAFQMGKPMPAKYTCDSANISPPLAWSGAPQGTKSFALICEDPDAPKGTFTRWVMYNIPATETQVYALDAAPNLMAGTSKKDL